jgi:protein-tyrosine phosphatase
MIVRALDLTWITEALAIGGRIPCDRASELGRAHAIGAIVDVRAEQCDDVGALQRAGIAFLHLPTPDHCAITRPMLCAGTEFAARQLARGQRLLVHCEHGIGRSALLALCVLVDRGHAPLAALALAKSRRACVSPSPAQYEAWADWLRDRDCEVPDFDAFAAIAYRRA